MLEIGLTHTSEMLVTPSHTAQAMGSGDLKVFATPAMIALMENAAMLVVAPHLPEESTTVGGFMDASHLFPSPVGATIQATATLTAIEDRKLTFTITAHDGDNLIGKAQHIRFIVDRKKFMKRVL